MTKPFFIGIDVSKDTLDVAISQADEILEWFQTPHTEDSISGLVERFKKHLPEGIVIEATGGFERTLAAYLAEAGLPVAVINPRQGRDFAKALGLLAKTDKIDARALARFGSSIKPAPRPIKGPTAQKLTDQVARRRQIAHMLAQEKNRLSRAVGPVKTDIEHHIAYLKERKNNLDKEIEQIIKDSPIYRQTVELLRTVPGVGPVTTATLVANCPELGNLSRRKIAALIGIAPLNKDSGKRTGVRCIWGGRETVRSQLYMATIAALHCNYKIKAFYDRLIKAGKKPKVAITACMRKLITILNAMVKEQRPWETSAA